LDNFQYAVPIQGGAEKVTRQAGLPPASQVGIDPVTLPPIVQGDPLNTVAVRNQGPHVAGQFASDGTFHSDRPADDGTLFADHGLSDPEAMPPGIERTTMPLPNPPGFGPMAAVQQREAVKAAAIAAGFVVSDAPGVPPAASVIQADKGSNDPRDPGGAPKVFSASDLPVIKKAPVVPLVLPTPVTRRVKAKVGR